MGHQDMYFTHSEQVWRQFPQLRALAMVVRNVTKCERGVADMSKTLAEVGRTLDATHESDLAPIQAWRKGYTAMGLKPTQYRCAAEALLRRFRIDRDLPLFHPLVDVLNAESMRAAIPIAAFDIANVDDGITVLPAQGDEAYTTFQGEIEHPIKGEIIFADAGGKAHSRRWVYRQGAVSVVRDRSDAVLIVAEALHAAADEDLAVLRDRLLARSSAFGITVSEVAIISPDARRLEYQPAA
jgi:DNA/RNA-binding domain of Phe-tRNA-synthetase-like protein